MTPEALAITSRGEAFRAVMITVLDAGIERLQEESHAAFTLFAQSLTGMRHGYVRYYNLRWFGQHRIPSPLFQWSQRRRSHSARVSKSKLHGCGTGAPVQLRHPRSLSNCVILGLESLQHYFGGFLIMIIVSPKPYSNN